tara:strand:- start:54 stop:2120 length:2067 start_codon:yes stop_codon:yes gene_type:complete
MKRLLAYLFIVFGLGLVFSVNGNAKVYCASADFVEIYDWSCSSSNWAPHFKTYAPTIKLNKKIYFLMREVPRRVVKELKRKKKRTGKNHDHLFYDLVYKYRSEIYEENKHQLVAKKEPSQTIKTYDWIAVIKHPKSDIEFIATKVSDEKNAKNIALKKCYDFVTKQLDKKGYNNCYVNFTLNEKENPQLAKEIIYKQTKNLIAKAEPSQTQEAASNDINESFCVIKTKKAKKWNAANFFLMKKNSICTDLIVDKTHKSFKSLKIAYGNTKKGDVRTLNINKYVSIFEEKLITIADPVRDFEKKEPTIKPKKKVKVAKKEVPKQEEFKPETGDIDNEAPVIQIAEAITVNDTDYEFQGKVTDQAKTIYVEVDGRPIDVKNGKFIVKGYSPIDKQISIEAIDQWGNRSEPKIVKLTIDIKDTSIAEKLEPLNPSKIRSKSSNNKVALIIGIENYLESPNAKYANLDAKYFFDYARKGFGVKKQNINLLVDEDATFVKTNKALTKWLRSKIKSGQSDLIIFFAGHGLASSDGKELYLLPQDSDPDLLARTALSRTELFQEIINLNPKSVTMFLDTCYSGVSRDEQMLLASARPIRIVADEQSEIPNNFTIFSASKLDQISSGLKEANHGIFSYYLMKGLEGNADSNQDKKITNGELLAYMDLNVSQKASELGRQQNPSLAGDPNKVLMSYR